MRPNTPHYVLTVDHSITYGRYFYATSTVRDSCWAIIHAVIGNSTLTSTEHPRTIQLLRRMLLWSLEDYEQVVATPLRSDNHHPASEHRMDPLAPDGLLDLVTLGNLIELIRCLDRRSYTDGIPTFEDAELEYARLAFAKFKILFCTHHHLIVDTQKVDPMTELFDISLLRFAVTLIVYKRRKSRFNTAFGLGELIKKIADHLSEFHARLVPKFTQDIQRPEDQLEYIRTFDWTGPDFTVGEGPSTPYQEVCNPCCNEKINDVLGVRPRLPKRCSHIGKFTVSPYWYQLTKEPEMSDSPNKRRCL
jgi:hypothetical protein